jgi:hypothetical protein
MDRHTTRACDHARAGQRPWSSRSPGSFAMHFCSCFVLTHGVHGSCPAHVRASSRGVWLAEQAWRPRPCVANRRSGSPRGHRPPLLRRAAFNGWNGAGTRAAKAARDMRGPEPSSPAPEARSPGWKTPPWSAGRRACFSRSTRRLRQGARLIRSALPALRSLTCVREKQEEARAPRLADSGAADAHLQFGRHWCRF